MATNNEPTKDARFPVLLVGPNSELGPHGPTEWRKVHDEAELKTATDAGYVKQDAHVQRQAAPAKSAPGLAIKASETVEASKK